MARKICMLLHEFYPGDIRVSKESSSLIAAGFEVHLICLQRKNEGAQEQIQGLHIHRIPIAQTHNQRGIWDILLSIRFFQPKFFKKLIALHKTNNFDVLHVHDLPLSKTALKAKESFPQLKVVLDFHENYPEALKVWFAWKKNPIIRLKNNLFFGFKRWLKYERQAAMQADQVIVVVDEMKQRLRKVHHIPEHKIIEVTNSETKAFLDQEKIPEVYDRNPGDFILAYTGNVGPHRGVDIAIKALKHLRDYPQIRLELTGKLSTAAKSWLEQVAVEAGVSDRIKINGYQPFHKFYSYMLFADVNLIPHNRNGHTDNTIPHKLYQGMLIGKPVIVSDAPPLRRVVEDLKSGLVFEAGNDLDFAEKIKTLYNDQSLAKNLGENGHQATFENLENWEHTSERLVKLHEELATESNRE